MPAIRSSTYDVVPSSRALYSLGQSLLDPFVLADFAPSKCSLELTNDLAVATAWLDGEAHNDKPKICPAKCPC